MAVATSREERVPGRTLDASVAPVVAVVIWAGLVLAARLWGLSVVEGRRLAVGAVPVVGRWDLDITPGLLVPLAIALATVAAGPAVASRLSFRQLLVVTGALAAAWAVALAASAGLAEVAAPLDTRYEHLAVLPEIGPVGTFLDTYVDRLADYPTHVKSHPPAFTVALHGLDRLGLSGPVPAAVLVIGFGASAASAVVVALRSLAGEAAARRAAPYLALAPAAVWLATSSDAIYAGLGAWAAALLVSATDAGPPARRSALAAAGGLVGAIGLHASYGLVLVLLVPMAVVVRRRAWAVIVPATGAAVAVTAAFVAGGFWWFDGLAAARDLYDAGVASRRPYGYFTLAGNPGAFALAVGPVVAIGLARLRDRGQWVIVGAALAAVLLADVSGLSKGEVERIWLPFVPWVVIAAAAAAPPGRSQAPYLAAHAGTGLALQAALVSPW